MQFTFYYDYSGQDLSGVTWNKERKISLGVYEIRDRSFSWHFVPKRFARDIDNDCVVNGQFLPKGATLEIPAGFLHHDPEYWPEPEKFIPER